MENYDKAFFDHFLGSQSSSYYAHLPKEGQADRLPELLSEHSALTVEYARSLAKANGLDSIIEHLVDDSIPSKLSQRKVLADKMKDLFWQAIAFHDLGKINHLFQKSRMKNFAHIHEVNHSFESQHSIISAYLYLAHFFSDLISMDLSDEEQLFLSNVALYMSYPIKHHHSASLDECQKDETWCERENGELVCRHDIEALCPFISIIKCRLSDNDIANFHECYLGRSNSSILYQWFNDNVFEQDLGFPLYALIKLLYSLLTASDYLATAHYMNNWKEMQTDYGIITEELRQIIINQVHTSKVYNRQTLSDIKSGFIIDPDDYRERNGHNLNILREGLAMEVIRNIRNNKDKRLFYIEAPTGGGKTNDSMLALSVLLEQDSTIQKIFYVFPFTTLITQTYGSMRDTLGLSDGEIVEYHSKSPKNTGKYEDDYLNYLETLFLNVPVVLLSHVSFFNVLKTNDKDYNYLLQRMAHSVIVIDEIQSYSPAIWDKIIYFIANYAEYFDMRFILMSATLPKIGELIENKKIGNSFVYLVNNKPKYFQNPNFSNRVTFDYSLLERKNPKQDDIEDYLKNLCDFVSEKSHDYAVNNSNNPNSVLAVIEFIFKKTASLFYDIVKNISSVFDEVLLLSGTILEPRRKQIITALKSSEYRRKKILLITTQVVEAGVDIDMDLGFKDTSLIDSEEQLAGRINRNANKNHCELYLFDCNTEKTIYGNDDRFKFTKQFSIEDYKSILSNKDFDSLYQLIIDKIQKKNQSHFIVNIQDLYRDVAHLDFKAVDKSFQIIDSKNITVFVPLHIKIELIDKSFISIIEELGITYGQTISGWNVWERYKEILLSQEEDFIQSRIKLNKTRALLSLFSFSIVSNGKEKEILETFGKEEYGYLFLESYSDVYSFENGINANIFHESVFL